jgi:hypothetical protein
MMASLFATAVTDKRFEQRMAVRHLTYVIRRSSFIRSSVVGITAAAWFLISNHCALAVFERARTLPVHSACHGAAATQPKPPIKSEQTPCCKTLRATLVKTDSSVAASSLSLSLQPYFDGGIAFFEQFQRLQSFELDTGPPFSESFAESVLQRSILVHAPPGLA